MKTFLRRKLKNQALQSFFAHLVHAYLKFVFKTSSWSYHGFENLDMLVQQEKSCIVSFFHGRLALMPFAWNYKLAFHMLLSDHSDGHFIAKVIQYAGIHSVYGSSTRGGSSASLTLIRLLRKKGYVGITPDGPRGPYQTIAPGITQIAKIAGAAIVPATYSIKRHRLLKTWDRFMFPLPFSKGNFCIGKPIYPDLNTEQTSNILRQAMVALEKGADEMSR